jgi:hypothetical protein
MEPLSCMDHFRVCPVLQEWQYGLLLDTWINIGDTAFCLM